MSATRRLGADPVIVKGAIAIWMLVEGLGPGEDEAIEALQRVRDGARAAVREEGG